MEGNLWLGNHMHGPGGSNIPEMGRKKNKKKGREGERCEVHKDLLFMQLTTSMSKILNLWLYNA